MCLHNLKEIIMTDIVTGSHPQTIISGRGNDGYGMGFGNGFGNNDAQRDIYPFLLMQRMEAGHADLVRDLGRENAAVALAVEKTAAASQLSVEKIGAAAALLAAQNQAATLAAIAACCCELKAQGLAVESRAQERELNQVRAELAALQARQPAVRS